MKPCNKCGVVKPLSEYHYHPSSRDDRQHVCKDCRSAHAKAHFQKIREKNIDSVRNGCSMTCRSCKEVKTDAHFDVSKAILGGFKKICKVCESARHKTMKYGISREDQHKLLDSQCNKCAICESSFDGFKFHMDHCHTTGKVRGALCGPCNRAIGLFKDSQKALIAAANYLDSFVTQPTTITPRP